MELLLNIYVLYMHIRKSDGVIFYIGIGDKDRPYEKNGRNQHWHNTVNKHGYEVVVINEGLTWVRACELEKLTIAFYGRRDKVGGCLVNMTDGGEGAHGRIMSEKTRQIIITKNKEVWTEEKRKQQSDERRLTNEEFVNKIKNIYSDVYDYSLVVYMGQNSKVTLNCKEHGQFAQWCGHLINGIGCQRCSIEKQSDKMRKPVELFIQQAKKIHGDKYDYSLVRYNGAKYKVEIKCPEHGVFSQTPDNHINGGNGCKECGKISVSEAQKKIKRGDRSKSKLVLDINTGVFYDCATDVAELYGIDKSTMMGWLNGKRTNKTSLRYV
jgi:hypothetical protein